MPAALKFQELLGLARSDVDHGEIFLMLAQMLEGSEGNEFAVGRDIKATGYGKVGNTLGGSAFKRHLEKFPARVGVSVQHPRLIGRADWIILQLALGQLF